MESSHAGDATWRSVARLFRGVGESAVPIDHNWGFRFRLSPVARRKLDRLLESHWLITFLTDRSLRIVPECVWLAYLEHLRLAGVPDERLRSIVSAQAVEVKFDTRGRLSLPKTAIEDINIFGDRPPRLFPGEVWLELWDEKTRVQYLSESANPVLNPKKPDAQSYPVDARGMPKSVQSFEKTSAETSGTMGADLKDKKARMREQRGREQ